MLNNFYFNSLEADMSNLTSYDDLPSFAKIVSKPKLGKDSKKRKPNYKASRAAKRNQQ